MVQNYVDEEYIKEILRKLKIWIDTDKNIALKKVLYKDNSLMFYKNPNAVETDTPEFKIDLPVEYFLDQTQTSFISEFIWSDTVYPESVNPNLDGFPVFVLAVKGADGTVSYSFINMKSLMNVYQASTNTSTVTISIDNNTNTISAIANLSGDNGNILTVGTDGGLYVPETDLTALQTQIQLLSDRVKTLENLLSNA